MNVIEIKDLKTLEKLRNGSVLMSNDSRFSAEEFVEHVKEVIGLKIENVYTAKGRLVNEVYGFTENNAYPDDIDIVFILFAANKDKLRFRTHAPEVKARLMCDIITLKKERERKKSVTFYTVFFRGSEDFYDFKVQDKSRKRCKEKAIEKLHELNDEKIAILITSQVCHRSDTVEGAYIGSSEIVNLFSKYTDEDMKSAEEWISVIESTL